MGQPPVCSTQARVGQQFCIRTSLYRAKASQIATHKTSDKRVITDMANPGGREYFFIVPNLTRQYFDCLERMVIKISFVYLR